MGPNGGAAQRPEPEKTSQIQSSDERKNKQHRVLQRTQNETKERQTFVYSAVDITLLLKRLTSSFNKIFLSWRRKRE
jgi:hypothetical protein